MTHEFDTNVVGNDDHLGRRVEETSPAGEDHHWIVLRTAKSEDSRHFRHFVDF